MRSDPIIDEVRRVREAHAAKFNYDLSAICADFRKQQSELGRPVVSRPPKFRLKTQTTLSHRRQPPPSIAGQGEIHDDLTAPAVPETDWDASAAEKKRFSFIGIGHSGNDQASERAEENATVATDQYEGRRSPK